MLSPSSTTRASSAANCSGAPSVRPAARPTVHELIASFRFCSVDAGAGCLARACLLAWATWISCAATISAIGAARIATASSAPVTIRLQRVTNMEFLRLVELGDVPVASPCNRSAPPLGPALAVSRVASRQPSYNCAPAPPPIARGLLRIMIETSAAPHSAACPRASRFQSQLKHHFEAVVRQQCVPGTFKCAVRVERCAASAEHADGRAERARSWRCGTRALMAMRNARSSSCAMRVTRAYGRM